MKYGKRLLRGILMFAAALCLLSVTVRVEAAGKTPTRTGTLELSAAADKNENEGWEWEPDAAGGGTLTLTDCYIQSEELRTLYFGNIAQGNTITIVLKGENIIETTSQSYGCMISANSYNGNVAADMIIREEGEGSLEVRTSEPITTGNSPIGFNSRSLKIESGSISSNIEICLLTEEFLMQDGSLVIQTPERIDDVFGICSAAGPVNIKGGTVDITAGHIGIIISSMKGEGWSVNISGGDVRIKARQSCIQLQNYYGLPEHRVINITGGTFTGESDITGLYADDIRIAKEGKEAPRVTVNVSEETGNPGIKAIHAIKELDISDGIIMADTIHNFDTASKENCIVFQSGNGVVFGEVTLDASLAIPDGSTLTIPADAVLNVPDNVTFNMPESASLVNNGMLVLPEGSKDISVSGTGMIQKGEEIYSNELIRLYPVTIETAGGEITEYYKAGALVELMPGEAPEGKVFKAWSVIPDTVEITDNSFQMPDSAVTVSPVYEDILFDIAVGASPEAGGTVAGGGKIKTGESVTVSAAANNGYTFTGWMEDGQVVSTDAKYIFTVSADRTLTACFEKMKKKIPENAPDGVMQVKNTVKAAADIQLPEGWSLDENDMKKTIPAGGYVEVTARYGREDAGDYETITVDMTIKRDACEELPAVVYSGTGEHVPDCTTEGIGHTECKLCGDIVRKSVKVPAAGHTAGEAVTARAATGKAGSITSHCTVCNVLMSEVTIDAIEDIRLDRNSGVYNGKIQTPSIIVKDRKGGLLQQNTDYTVSYPKEMKKVGVYSVTVIFQGNYEGTIELTFTIVPKGTSFSKVKAKKKGFSLKWKKQSAETTGYEIQYAATKNFTKKTTKNVTVKKNKITSKSISKKKANKKYYVRIRTYKNVRINGKTVKITSQWSKVKTVKTKK